MNQETKNWIPAINDFIDKIKKDDDLKGIESEILKRSIKAFIQQIKSGEVTLEKNKESVLNHYIDHIKKVINCPLKPVVNATGILLHTNLGRAPISERVFDLLKGNCLGYTNIEFDLETGKRAYRDNYLKDIFRFIVGAEDVVVVNNNAASLYLILKTFAQGKEVIMSRGEQIEIGGSFRIPDILTDAGAILREVGTTNCTRISDYESAINENTVLILKAHTSNFTISGHTESVGIEELVALSRKYDIPFVYDAGSGLIRKPLLLSDTDEPVISECIEKGVDVVCFSGDKLMGSMQAGIILGSSKYLSQMKKHPMMRVLRADKFKITGLYHSVSMFKSEQELVENNKVFAMLSQTEEELHKKAMLFSKYLDEYNIKHKVLKSFAQVGGGSLPEVKLKSYEIELSLGTGKGIAEKVHNELLNLDIPILCVLRERKLYFDVFVVEEEELRYMAQMIR